MALCQQSGWTPELGEAAGDFGGWEEGERAELGGDAAGAWTPRSAGRAEGDELHIPEREARWQCGRDGVPGQPAPCPALGGPLSLTDDAESPHTKSPLVSAFPSRRPAAGQRSAAPAGRGKVLGGPSLTWSLGETPGKSQGTLTAFELCLHGRLLSDQGHQGQL